MTEENALEIIYDTNNFLLDSVKDPLQKKIICNLIDGLVLNLNNTLTVYEKIRAKKLKLENFFIDIYLNKLKIQNKKILDKFYANNQAIDDYNAFGRATGVIFSKKIINIGLLSPAEKNIDFEFFVRDAYLHELGHLIQYKDNNFFCKLNDSDSQGLAAVLPTLIPEVRDLLLIEPSRLPNGFYKRPETDNEKFLEGLYSIGRETYAEFFTLVFRSHLEKHKTKAFLNYMYRYRKEAEEKNKFIPKTHYVIYAMDLLAKSKILNEFDFDTIHAELNILACHSIYRFILNNKEKFINCAIEHSLDHKNILAKLESLPENQNVDFADFDNYVLQKINSPKVGNKLEKIRNNKYAAQF